jgi:hypothetical protein
MNSSNGFIPSLAERFDYRESEDCYHDQDKRSRGQHRGETMKRRSKPTGRRQPPPAGELAGNIVHVQYHNLEFLMNDFAVILRETAKTVVAARLATVEQIDEQREDYAGFERPLLQDGKLAVASLVQIFRLSVSRTIDTHPPLPTRPLVARLRMDENLFHHTARVQTQRPQPGQVLVEVFRLSKRPSQGDALSFYSRTHFPHYYNLWDGEAKGFAYPGFGRPATANRRP